MTQGAGLLGPDICQPQYTDATHALYLLLVRHDRHLAMFPASWQEKLLHNMADTT
jgi:hypothetical protein